VLSDKGVQPDPKKVAAIQEMEPPRNRQELKTLLGMVNYLAKLTPNLAETTAPKRNLLKKDSEFVWDCVHDTAFKPPKAECFYCFEVFGAPDEKQSTSF